MNTSQAVRLQRPHVDQPIYGTTSLAWSGNNSQALAERLAAKSAVIDEIRSITGNAGISLGVLHNGRVIHRANYGFRDVAEQSRSDSDTVYQIGSLTKAMVSVALAMIVEQGKVSWETKLSELVPEYRTSNANLKVLELATEANIIDLLAHRLGVTAGNNFWSQKQQQVLIDKAETARLLGSLQPLAPFRSKMIYSNWGYGLPGELLEQLSGQNLGQFVKEHLFDPLQLEHTTMGHPSRPNVARSYMALSNAEPYEVPPSAYNEGLARAGAGAAKSTVNDLLKLYDNWLTAAERQAETGTSQTEGSPFVRTADLWAKHSVVSEGTDYGLGWVLTELPGKGGLVGVNGYESPKIPIIAKGMPKQRMIYHQGSVTGALSAIYLLPGSHTAIVVLSNSFDLCDTPDWIAQVLIETLLDVPHPNDYVDLARRASANALSHHRPTSEQLVAERRPDSKPSQLLAAYEGRYFNKLGNFFLDVTATERDDGLLMAPQGFKNTSYALHHHHDDVFAWDCDRDAESKEALYPQFAPGFHKVSFGVGADGSVQSCNWQIDKAIKEGETFQKQARERL